MFPVGEAPLQQNGCQLPWAHVSAKAGELIRLRLQFLPYMLPDGNESTDRRRRIGWSTTPTDKTVLQLVQQRHHAERPVRFGYDRKAPRRTKPQLQVVGPTRSPRAPSRSIRVLHLHPVLRSRWCGHWQLPFNFNALRPAALLVIEFRDAVVLVSDHDTDLSLVCLSSQAMQEGAKS